MLIALLSLCPSEPCTPIAGCGISGTLDGYADARAKDFLCTASACARFHVSSRQRLRGPLCDPENVLFSTRAIILSNDLEIRSDAGNVLSDIGPAGTNLRVTPSRPHAGHKSRAHCTSISPIKALCFSKPACTSSPYRIIGTDRARAFSNPQVSFCNLMLVISAPIQRPRSNPQLASFSKESGYSVACESRVMS